MAEAGGHQSGALSDKFEAVERLLGFIAGIVVAGVTVVILYDVVARYIFSKPTSWAVDVAEMAMVPIVYLALGYTTQVGGHVRMDLLVSRFSIKNQNVLALVSDVFGLVFAAAALWSGWDLAVNYVRRWPTTTASSLPQAPVAILVPLGCFLFLVQLLLLIRKDVSRLRNPSEDQRAHAAEIV